ncbi:hypothetical protein BHM03_00058823, partial [Ensete ventricosum]
AAALACGNPGSEAAPYGLTASNRPLRPGRGRLPLAAWPRALPTPAGANHARGSSRMLVAAPARGFGCGQPPLQRAWPEIVYPCIPDPDEEDKGGQASSSLVARYRVGRESLPIRTPFDIVNCSSLPPPAAAAARPLSLPSSFQPAFFTTMLLSSSITATSYSSPPTATSAVAPPSRRAPMPQRSLLLATPSSPVHNSTTSASCYYSALDVAASSLAAIALLVAATFFLFNCSLNRCSSLTLQHMLLTITVGLLPLCSNHCPQLLQRHQSPQTPQHLASPTIAVST